MRKFMVLSLLAIFAAGASNAEVLEHPRNLKEEASVHAKHKKLWLWSTMAVVAASFADSHSSWGKLESNGLLKSQNGTFGAKGFGLKMGIVGGMLLGQKLILDAKPGLAPAMTWLNFGTAGLKTAVATRNYGIEKPKYLLKQD